MPEALACLLVFAICVAAYVAAQLASRDPARQNVTQDVSTLRQHRAWLQQRLEKAQRENWGEDMVETLAAARRARVRSKPRYSIASTPRSSELPSVSR